MTDSAIYAAPTPAAPDAFGAAPSEQRVKVEFVMDSHRVLGELRYLGPPRRLVDTLNSIDSGYITVYDGHVDNAIHPDRARRFEVAQIRRDAIMFAIPCDPGTHQGTTMEAVHKVPVHATIVLPGYEITGKAFLLPEADPAKAPILSSRHFIPLTDVEITPAQGDMTSGAPLAVVNLARALFYAPNTSSG